MSIPSLRCSGNSTSINNNEQIDKTTQSENHKNSLVLKTLNIAATVFGGICIGLGIIVLIASFPSPFLSISSSIVLLSGMGIICLAKICQLVNNLKINKEAQEKAHPIIKIPKLYDQLTQNIIRNATHFKFYLDWNDNALIDQMLVSLGKFPPSQASDEIKNDLLKLLTTYTMGSMPIMEKDAELFIDNNMLLLRGIGDKLREIARKVT